MALKLARPRRSRNRRSPVILGGAQLAIRTCEMFVLRLHRRWREMMLVLELPFPFVGTSADSASPAVVAYAIHGHISDHRAVHVRVVNLPSVDVHHCGVVPEHSAFPSPANETD